MIVVLIGTGSLKEELKQYAESKGVAERKKFKGLVPRTKAFEEMFSSDMYVSSTYDG